MEHFLGTVGTSFRFKSSVCACMCIHAHACVPVMERPFCKLGWRPVMEGLEVPAHFFGEHCKFISEGHMRRSVRKMNVAVCV